VSAQLSQLLGQLDRPGSTELVIATGRQVAVRINGVFQTLTAAAVTLPQLQHLIRDTQLVAMIPASDKVGDPVPLDLDGRPLLAQFVRQGGDVLLRIEHRPAPQPPARVTPLPGTMSRVPTPNPGRDGPTPTSTPRTLSRSTELPVGRSASQDTPTGTGTLRGYRSHPTTPPNLTAAGVRPSRARPTTPPHGSSATMSQSGVHALPLDRAPAGSSASLPISAGTGPAIGLIDEPTEVVAALMSVVAEARRRGATDLHIATHRPVMVRTVGDLIALDPAPSSPADVDALLLPLLGPVRRQQLAERGYVDLAVDVPGSGRLRTNISRQQGGLKGAFRLAVTRPPTLEQLGLPAALAKVTENHQGLVVIAGPSGHGKTTTLAALVDVLNRADPIHILTIEDPVEIVHPRHAAVVSQREVGRHTTSFAAALKASLREDPDVIVIGELRDRETVEIALTAAETGHLVLATMSTPSAAKTIDRLIDMFPPADQSQVRASLGAALKAIVAQRLLPGADGTSAVVAVELLVGMLALSNLIRDNKLFQLPNLMQRGRAYGMIRLDDSLLELVRAGKLTEDVALRYADSKKELLAALHPPAAPIEPVKRGLFGRKDRE
jgi:twitching motility protein PilT